METKQSNNSATPMADAVKIANQRALFSLEWENDTVFKKRELNYKTKAAFQKDLEAGKISKYTTVFIKDSKEIYKNGQYYGNSEGSVVSGNFTECMQVNSELSTEIFSNLKPPFGKQTTFTPSEGLKNLLINNVSKNISLITFDYGGGNITFSANITGDSQVVILTMNIHTFPALLGFGTGFSLITIQLDIESNSVTIAALPVPCLSSEATGNSFFCDDGQFKKIDSLAGFDEISLSLDIVDGTTNSGNFTETEYNKILAASEKGFIIVNLNGIKLLSNVLKDVLPGSKTRLTLSIGQIVKFEGVMLLANNITIKDKSENYAFTSDTFITNIYNGLQDGHIKINTNSGADSKEIDLIVNGNGTKFLSDNGEYKEIQQGDNSKQSVYVNLNNYLSNVSGNGTIDNWSTLKPLLDECCNAVSDAEGDKNSGKKQLIATYYLLPFLRATMSAKNDSNYVLTFAAYGYMLNINITDNGSSATYSIGLINIDDSGDGTKYLSDNGNYSEPEGHKIDITNIYKRIDALETGAKIEKDDYDKLRKYTINKNALFISDISKGVIISDIVNDMQQDGSIVLRYTTYPYGLVSPVMQLIIIDSNLVINKYSYPYCEAITLDGYKKANNYSHIVESDSILDAIEKLDAGMSYKTLGFEFCSLTESSQLSDVNNSLKPSFSSLEDLYNYISKDGKIKIAYTQTSADCQSDATSSYYSTNNGGGSYTRMITISSTCMKFAQNEFGGIIKIQYTVKSGSISSVSVAKKQFQLI